MKTAAIPSESPPPSQRSRASGFSRPAIIAGATIAASALLLFIGLAAASLLRRHHRKKALDGGTRQRRTSFVIHPRAEDEDEWEALSRVTVGARGIEHRPGQRSPAKAPHYMLRSRPIPDHRASMPQQTASHARLGDRFFWSSVHANNSPPR